MSGTEEPMLAPQGNEDDEAAAHVARARRVRAETAALVRATDLALDRSEAALRRLRRLEDLVRAAS